MILPQVNPPQATKPAAPRFLRRAGVVSGVARRSAGDRSRARCRKARPRRLGGKEKQTACRIFVNRRTARPGGRKSGLGAVGGPWPWRRHRSCRLSAWQPIAAADRGRLWGCGHSLYSGSALHGWPSGRSRPVATGDSEMEW